MGRETETALKGVYPAAGDFLGLLNGKRKGKEVEVRTPGPRLSRGNSEASGGHMDWGQIHTGSKCLLFFRTESGRQCTYGSERGRQIGFE